MADSEIIKHTDLVEEGAVRDYLQKEFQDLVAYLPTVEAAIDKTAKNLNASLKGFKIENIEDVKKLNEAIKETAKISEVAAKVQKVKIELTAKEQAQAQIDKSNKRDEIALLKATIIEMDKTVGSLQRVEAANTRLRLERKKLNTDTEEGRKKLIDLNEAINQNNKYIIENSDKLKQQKLNVGNYTESIKKAFEGTGELGEAINKYLGIITLLSEKIEGVVGLFIKESEAKTADTAATASNTEASEASTAATEAGTVAAETNTTAKEAETVATEELTVANEGLGKSLLKLATNPYVIAAAAIALLAKVVYDNLTATQAQKDQFDATKEAAEAYAKAIDVAGLDAGKLARAIKELTLEEFKRQDLDIKALVVKKELRAEAAKARSEATEENKTTRDRIVLLQEFVDKTKEAFKLQREELQEDIKIRQGFVDAYGKFASREQRKQLQEAVAALADNAIETANAVRKAQNQITQLTEKYNEELRKMRQDAQKEEIEAIDTFSKYKAEQLNKQLAKDLALNKIETEQAVENLKHKQDELGAIDKLGVDHTQEFQDAINSLQKLGAAKATQLEKKTKEEILKLNEDFQLKRLESERKFQEDLRKLDESYIKLTGDVDKQGQDNVLARNQAEIDHQQNEITDLREQRNEDIDSGKKEKHLSLQELKTYFDEIDKLEAVHYAETKKALTDSADFSKYVEENKTNDAIQEIKNRYAKIKEETEKAIGNKNISASARASELNSHAAELAQQEADEIEKIRRNLAEQILLIDIKLKGDLSKADEDELKMQRAILKEKQGITKEEIADQKKLAAERKKILDEITDGIKEGLQKRSEIQQQADQRDIDFHQRIIEVQTKLAAAGQDNILAEEEARADKAEEKKIQDAKKAAKVEQEIAIVKVFADTLNNALDKKEPFLQAFGEATAASGLVSAVFARLFSGFYEGTDSLDGTNAIKLGEGKDNLLIRAHEGERIFGVKDSEKVEGYTNKEIIEKALAFDSTYTPIFKTANVSTTSVKENSHDYMMANVLRNEIRDLKKAVESRPISHTNLNGLGEWVEQMESNGLKKIIYHKKTRPSMRRNG